MGIFYAATAYNTFAVTVPSFVGALDEPPDYIFKLEEARAAPGPAIILTASMLSIYQRRTGKRDSRQPK